MPPRLDLLAPEVLADPYPTYARLRREDPVHWSDSLDGWALTRYADCAAFLRDERFTADRLSYFVQNQSRQRLKRIAPLVEGLRHWMLVKDPPDHTRLRGLMQHAFTPKALEAWRGRIQEIVDHLLVGLEREKQWDAIRDFAYPLPAIVIAEMIGVPREDRDDFKAWSDDIAAFVGSFHTAPGVAERASQAMERMARYFQGLITLRRREPQQDLLSDLLRAEEQGQRLSDPEMIANCGFLLFAGHETTTHLIGNGLLALFRFPDQMQRLRDSPALAFSAVEELLRFDGPLDRISRIALEDLDLDGRRVAKGRRVIALTNAANRDPARFADPDRLDLTRPDNKHLAFGWGPHFCLGGPLARLEAQIAFPALLERFPTLQPAPTRLEWQDSVGFRGLQALPVET